jgi:Zn-finger nucleic acid-binding protein
VSGVRVDGCDGCGGVWFDRSELTAVAQAQAAQLTELEDRFQHSPFALDTNAKMYCPHCKVELFEFEFQHSPGIKLDGCPQCKGIWIDDGELLAIHNRLAAAQPPNHPTTQQRAHQALGFLTNVACPHCKQPNPSASLVCWACGAVLKDMRPPADLTPTPAPQKTARPWRDPTQDWKRWLGWGLVIFGVIWLLVVGGMVFAMIKQSERGCMDLIWALPAGFLILVGFKIVLPLTLTGGVEMLREGQISPATGGCLGAFAGFTVGVIVLFILGGGVGLLFGIYLIPFCILIGWAIGVALPRE